FGRFWLTIISFQAMTFSRLRTALLSRGSTLLIITASLWGSRLMKSSHMRKSSVKRDSSSMMKPAIMSTQTRGKGATDGRADSHSQPPRTAQGAYAGSPDQRRAELHRRRQPQRPDFG